VSFAGFPAEAVTFYVGLEADNSKAYFDAHRAQFEAAVRAPMEALVASLADRYGPARILRPHRDVRFSKDKTPYRTELGAMIGEGYVSIGAAGLGAGAGYFHLAPDQLDRYRAAVDAEPAGSELAAAVARVGAAGIGLWGTEPLKTAPRGYAVDHPRIELLRYRGVVAWKRWEPGPWLSTAAAVDRVIELFEVAAPLCAWLREQVGPTVLPRRR
jgi:uncharacterized protein (TIGR02453 family)